MSRTPVATWMSKKEIDDRISVSNAARLLGITREQIVEMIDSGDLSVSKVGHGYRLSRREIRQYKRRQNINRLKTFAFDQLSICPLLIVTFLITRGF